MHKSDRFRARGCVVPLGLYRAYFGPETPLRSFAPMYYAVSGKIGRDGLTAGCEAVASEI
ncbi:hypothetical protein N7492_002012 [Penicillium capsulatum]|uniref:Uncharacterized protein n=1 Tax=Penicillium capsulatum TaxID=69766 RepID=A0A9W9IJB6_9EURO|nr:hypothetical protein N7492_002012 [Penicillium capsulatum]